MYKRQAYIEHLLAHKDKDYIKVVTGIRRSGKSTILLQYQDELKKQGISEKQIIQKNFDDLENEEFLDYRLLYKKLLEETPAKNERYYIFLDEIQMVSHFEKVLASLQLKKNIDIYITGSNAYLLSGDLATLLSGRFVEILVLPFSFNEYYDYLGGDKNQAFQNYLENGGFPYAASISDKRTFDDYIQGVLNTVLVKDVMNRKKFTDSLILESIAKFIFSNVGSLTTIKGISNALISANRKTTAPTVENYLSGLMDALIIYKVDRFNISGKKYLHLNSKYYLADLSLKNAYLGKKRPNRGHDLENIVYIELVRRGYNIYVGDTKAGEVDFVAVKEGVTTYYQVSSTVKDENTYQREISSLQAISDNYRKILLTEDLGNYNDNGIEQINLIDWLITEI
ncbi:ATP-binding protein [Lactovum odontotermitis]